MNPHSNAIKISSGNFVSLNGMLVWYIHGYYVYIDAQICSALMCVCKSYCFNVYLYGIQGSKEPYGSEIPQIKIRNKTFQPCNIVVGTIATNAINKLINSVTI